MKILTMTNTFTPPVGGVARSIAAFTAEHRRCGHEVLVVAPDFDEASEEEEGVIRVPAILKFNGSDFSFPVPVPMRLRPTLDDFGPEVVHSNHPFLLGDTALRISAERNLPVVFTHHTLYEQFAHYLPGESSRLTAAAIDLAVGYSNLCDAVIAPSQSMADLLVQRGVTSPLSVIPTGVDLEVFSGGDGLGFRFRCGIPEDATVVGHVGRLAPEKNLPLLAEAVAIFLSSHSNGWFLIAGTGPALEQMDETFQRWGVAERVRMFGVLDTSALADAYDAMDIFAFASRSETQGMVLTEAMAARTPVAALDGPGVRDLVVDGVNGKLAVEEDPKNLAAALGWLADLPPERRRETEDQALATAEELSISRTAARARDLFLSLRPRSREIEKLELSPRHTAQRRLAEEWKILRNLAHALGDLVVGEKKKLVPREEDHSD